MILCITRRTFYLDLYSIFNAGALTHYCRAVSTRSAIRRGLRATGASQDGPSGSYSRIRGHQRDSVRNNREGNLFRVHSGPSRGERIGSIRRQGGKGNPSKANRGSDRLSSRKNLTESRQHLDEDKIAWADIRELREVLAAIQRFEVATVETPSLSRLRSDARSKIREINTSISAAQTAATRKSYLIRVENTLSDIDGHLRQPRHGQTKGVALRTLVVERPDQSLELVARNQPLSWARSAYEVHLDLDGPGQTRKGAQLPAEAQGSSLEVVAGSKISTSLESLPHLDRLHKQQSDSDGHPISIPYTTAASAFLYGYNVVLAALRARRRRLYYLYLNQRALARDGNMNQLTRLAEDAGIPVRLNTDLRLLDKMSGDRPHNGVVMEASNLPSPPVLTLGEHNIQHAFFPLELPRQSAEEIQVNGAPTALATSTSTWRYPFIVLLDGITDPGNIGNILRSAHFYGVDAVAVATNTCAPLSSATLAKASSGACEAVCLLSLPRPANFVFNSSKAGWKVYAAVAPPRSGKSPAEDVARAVTTLTLSSASPLANHPCILMLGSEGEGLRANLTSKAHHLLSIEPAVRGGDPVDVGVDSLNVSVAGGVLMESFLRKPEGSANILLDSDDPLELESSSEADRENAKIALQGGDLGF